MLLLLASCSVDAWGARLPREVVGSGATASGGGGVRLAGTVGQAIIGPSAGAGQQLRQGFWPASNLIVMAVDPPGGGTPTASSVRFGAAVPNPSDGHVRFELSLPREARIELQVLDVHGRVSAHLDAGRLGAGTHALSFDATLATLPSAGVWFARLLVDGREHGTRRFIRLR